MSRNYPRVMATGVDADGDAGYFSLRLYIAGNSDKSVAARSNLRRLCELHLYGRHETEIIDIEQEPQRAAEDRILVTPTLVRRRPGPVKRIVGDLSNSEKLLAGLGIRINAGSR